MRWRRLLPALSAGLVATPLAAEPGLYGNVRVHRETGDLLGAEIAIHQGDRPWVEFVLCEGWCNSAVNAQIERMPGGFAFDFVEPLAHQDGSPAKPIVSRVVARQVGRKLRITVSGDMAFEMVLKPLNGRFGLDVAKQCESCKASTYP